MNGCAQGATDTRIVRKASLPPTGDDGLILHQRVGRLVQVFQVFQSRQNRDQKLDQLALRRIVALALVNRHRLQALDQPQLSGVFAQQDQQRMVGAGVHRLTQVAWPDQRRDPFGFTAVAHPKHQSARVRSSLVFRQVQPRGNVCHQSLGECRHRPALRWNILW
jgi:hypothetical protein